MCRKVAQILIDTNISPVFEIIFENGTKNMQNRKSLKGLFDEAASHIPISTLASLLV